MKEFFGLEGYTREPEGYLSWQHLVFVTSLMIIMTSLAIWLGKAYRNTDAKHKNLPLIVAAIMINCFELFKIVLVCIRGNNALGWLYELPLFLCSIQLITIPLAAFAKGRVKEAALDFVFIFGILGAVLGTYAAGNNYSCYPVLSFDNVISGITHSISGFSSLYIAISGMSSMKRKNIPITFAILLSFCAAATVANITLDYNYMFLVRADGTPYEIIYNIANGNSVIYPILVIVLFVIYIVAFHLIYNYFKERKLKAEKVSENEKILISAQ